MLRAVLSFVICALVAATTTAHAEDGVTLNQRTNHYDVGGSTMTALAASIKANRPSSIGGFIGETTFYFSWTYDTETRRDSNQRRYCQVVNAEVVIDIDVNLPRFTAVADAPAAIRRFWRPFIAALEDHELQHARDFIDAGERIPAALNAINASNCWAIDAKVNDIGMTYVELAQLRADEYDEETDHGTLNGALFPGF